ncbi:MAG: MFS transporter [Halioglobus sp.]
MISLKTRTLYGAGGAVYATKEAAFTMFILMFYTQVMGLDGSITGLIISLSLVWDAVSDPLVGALSDRSRSKHGRRHPFLYASIVPLGVGFYGLFSPPESFIGSNVLLGGWLLFWSLWIRTFITTFAVPHLALSAEITSDYHQRSQVLGARLAFMFIFTVGLPAVGLLYIFAESGGVDGRFELSNYPIYGGLSCLVIWVMGTASTVGTRRYAFPPQIAPETLPPRVTLLSLIHDLLLTFRNRNFRLILGYEIAAMISYGAIATLNMLVWTYYWEFSAMEVSMILAIPSLLAVGLVMISLGPLTRRFQKNRLLQLSILGLILNCLWLYPLRFMDWLPANGTPTIFVLNFLFMMLFMYLFLLRAINTQSIIADITDEHELDHGTRQEGGFFATTNFTAKLASVFGPVYGGVALDIINLEAGALPGEVPQNTLDGLAYAMGLGALPALFVAYYFVVQIKVGQKDVEQIQARIKERRASVQ